MFGCIYLMGTLFLVIRSGRTKIILEWWFREIIMIDIRFLMVVDVVRCAFGVTVLWISASVVLFRGFYMSHEVFPYRFVFLVCLFVISILLLIFFPRFLCLMLGWDGLGAVSFLLVIYYINNESLSAGIITAIRNRIGDVFFIILIGVFSCVIEFNFFGELYWISGILRLLLVFGSITKRAQIPFSAWLPEAIAAPTPVSALVHSSTLVTAGVYIIVRFGELLERLMIDCLFILSLITIIIAGSGGLVETDIKKVVALSTLSQVGIIMFVASVGATIVCFFHLVIHAFFKALMFMCVGGVIFYTGGCQDGRVYGGLWFKIPLTCGLLIFTNISLIGFPFMSGFYSKELIVASILLSEVSIISLILFILSLVLTIGYSFRIMFLINTGIGVSPLNHFTEHNIFYRAGLLLIRWGAVVVGVVVQLLINDLIFFLPLDGVMFYSRLTFFLFFSVNLLGVCFIRVAPLLKVKCNLMLSDIWFLKRISGNYLRRRSLILFYKVLKYVELGWIRGFILGKGLRNLIFIRSKKVHKFNFNRVILILIITIISWLIVFII